MSALKNIKRQLRRWWRQFLGDWQPQPPTGDHPEFVRRACALVEGRRTHFQAVLAGLERLEPGEIGRAPSRHGLLSNFLMTRDWLEAFLIERSEPPTALMQAVTDAILFDKNPTNDDEERAWVWERLTDQLGLPAIDWSGGGARSRGEA